VTSALAVVAEKAEDGQGVSGSMDRHQKARKLFVIKILTSNP
jgi:hypothetical protein